MAPVRLDPSHFSPDTCAFLEALAARDVRYLIVGGEAVVLHGHVRLTGDVDFFFARDRQNLERLFSALQEFWDGDVPGIEAPEELGPVGLVVQFGQPPNRIDLVNDIDGVSFDEAWPDRVEAVIGTEQGDVRLAFIGLEALVKNKRASGRPKDLDDLSYLRPEP
ncbi:MAG: nucleotidyltransferase [Gemmatimonadota bacterium]